MREGMYLVTLELHGRGDYTSYSDNILRPHDEAYRQYKTIAGQVQRSIERGIDFWRDTHEGDIPFDPSTVDLSEADIDTDLGVVYGNDLKAIRLYRVEVEQTFPELNPDATS